MSHIVARAGRVHIRVGGNTQETATLVETLADGKILEKDHSNTHSTVSYHRLIERMESLTDPIDTNATSVIHAGTSLHDV